MKRPLRLWGKKRGKRMTGWWLLGRVGQASFFGALMLLGISVLTIVSGWQIFWPETNVFAVGYGFWLLILISISFIGIGAFGFTRQVLSVAVSDEHRAAMSGGSLGTKQKSNLAASTANYLPSIFPYTDSPGTYLQFRLPEANSQTNRLILTALLILIWDTFVIVMGTMVVGRLLAGNRSWIAIIIVGTFVYIAILLTKRFLKDFFYATRVGSTVIEVDQLPLFPDSPTKLQLVQHGRMSLKSLTVSLVCEEKVTYHFGTDVRVEAQEVERLRLLQEHRIRVEDGNPLRLQCALQLPPRAMHSFGSPHNAITWRIEVEGKVSRWPSFCRNFPVVVYPRVVQTEKVLVRS
jgi:hypothetical protein